jgi:hypothetical protein
MIPNQEDGMIRKAALATLAIALACSPSFAEITIHEEHSFDAHPGSSLEIDASFHEVKIMVAPTATVDVTVDIVIKGNGGSSKKLAQELQPEFLDKGDRLIVRSARTGRGWSWKSMSTKGKITVAMPSGMDLLVDVSSGSTNITGDMGDAVVHHDASSGSLRVSGAMRELHAGLSSGSVKVAVDRPLQRFSAEASSGSIRLEGGAHAADAETSSGSIKLFGLLGSANLGASSGSISAQWEQLRPAAKVKAGASSGSVTLRFPPGTSFSGTAKVSSGGLHSDFPAMVRGKKNLEFDGGPNAVELTVSTSSGSVKLLED